MVASFSSQVILSTCGFSCRWSLKRKSTLSHKMCTTTPVSNSKTIFPIENEMKKRATEVAAMNYFPSLVRSRQRGMAHLWLTFYFFELIYLFFFWGGGGGGRGWVGGGVNTTDPVVRIVQLQCMFCSFLIIGSAHKCISNTTRLTSSISSTGSSGSAKNDNIIKVTNMQMDNTLTKGSLNEQSYTLATTV